MDVDYDEGDYLIDQVLEGLQSPNTRENNAFQSIIPKIQHP
jgi:hypothetical protein